jgi:N-methylhydantoinase B
VNFERHVCPPWGVHGGLPAQPGIVRVFKGGTGEPDVVYKSEHYALEPGDVVLVETGGGGGYGPPAERQREAVRRDLMRGYITAEAARRDYAFEPHPAGDER